MTDTTEVAGAPGIGALGRANVADASTAPAGSQLAAGASAEPAAGARRASRKRRSRVRLALVFAVLLAAVVYLLVEGLGSSLDYFDTVAQTYAHKAAIGTETIRLEGLVVRGSIKRTARGADFAVSGGGHEVTVHNVGSPPQLFQPDIPVVVVGHFAGRRSYLFVSDQIMVKHTASYIAAHPTRVRAPDGKTLP